MKEHTSPPQIITPRENKPSKQEALRELLKVNLTIADQVITQVMEDDGVSALHAEVAERWPDLGRHMDRVARLATLIGVYNRLDETDIMTIAGAAKLHDVGKLTIPDMDFSDSSVWPSEQVAENLKKVQPHSENGARLVEMVNPSYAEVIRYHHTWQDHPYPSAESIRLQEDDQNVSHNRELARYIAMADQYDAFMTRPKQRVNSQLWLLGKDYLKLQGEKTARGRLRKMYFKEEEVNAIAIGYQLLADSNERVVAA